MFEIGKKIKGLREKSGLSQEKLARSIGVSRSAISQIERGMGTRGRPSIIQ